MICFACKRTKSALTDERELRVEGWHNVSGNVLPGSSSEEKSELLGTDVFWLCPKCVRGAVQCIRCGLRTNADAARTGHGYDAFVGTEVTVEIPWTCVGEPWEWICSACARPN